MGRSRVPGKFNKQFAPPVEKRSKKPAGWKRFYLNSATRVDPSGGANLTINSESSGAYTDVTRDAVNKKKPCTENSAFFYTLRNPDNNNVLKWGDEWTVHVHLVTNQYSDGSSGGNGRGQSLCAVVTNSTALDSSDHHYFGCGTYNLDDTKIRVVLTLSGDRSNAPTLTTKNLSNSGFTQQSRHLITLANTKALGMKNAWIEYRDFDNTTENGGVSDINGYDYDDSALACAASDTVYLCLFFPGINSSSAMHLTNHQFKAYFKVTMRDADPVSALGE